METTVALSTCMKRPYPLRLVVWAQSLNKSCHAYLSRVSQSVGDAKRRDAFITESPDREVHCRVPEVVEVVVSQSRQVEPCIAAKKYTM